MPNTPAQEQCIDTIRFLAVDAVQKANSGHPGMPLGAAAMAFTLWTRHLRFDPRDPSWFDRDRFVLSAGHGSMLLYALLYLTGYELSLADLESFRQRGSKTPGHPEVGHTPGVEATTGPLGQGIANAVGIAVAQAHLAATYNRAERICDHHTYAIVGDGDLMEGISQEAISLAGHLQLGRLIVLYDDNRVSLAGPTEITFTDDHIARFEACGWHVQFVDIEHGNDVESIDAAIAAAKSVEDRPSLVCVRTHIGYGSPLADSFKAHGEPLGAENVAKTKEHLGWPLTPPFYVPEEALAFFRSCGERGSEMHAEWSARFARWKTANAPAAAQLERALRGEVPKNLPLPEFDESNGAVATRDAGGIVMNAIAAALPELVGGSADLDPSTKTYLKNCGDFQPSSYAGRNIHFGVREHAMAAIVNGIALHGGLLPFAATFFNFLDYCKPAVRLSALSHLHAFFIFTHDSFLLGEDGPTHQPIEQLASLRALPNAVVVRPADALEVRNAWEAALADKGRPWIFVLTRQKVPFLGKRAAPVERGAYILVDCEGKPDCIFIATGSEVAVARDAAALLSAEGKRIRVVSMPSWELFDAQPKNYRESVLPSDVRERASVEASATLGWERYVGLDGFSLGVDRFGLSAPMADAIAELQFTPAHLADLARQHFESLRR